MKILAVTVTTIAILWLAAQAHADDNAISRGFVEAKGMGTVDMSKTANRIQAKLLAKRAAVVDAQRNLLETIKGVRVTSGTTVKDAELQSDIIANRVKGLLRGAFTVHDSITEDSGDLLAEVTLGVCLTSAAPQCKAHPTLAHIIYDTLQKTAPAGTFKAPANPDIGKVTGVVVDTRKLDFEPRFDARLVTGQGQEVYGPGQFDIKSGGDWLHWTRSMADATANTAVVGDHPLNVVATGTSGDSGVILDNDDAVRVFQANLQNGNFLSRGKVIFVTR